MPMAKTPDTLMEAALYQCLRYGEPVHLTEQGVLCTESEACMTHIKPLCLAIYQLAAAQSTPVPSGIIFVAPPHYVLINLDPAAL